MKTKWNLTKSEQRAHSANSARLKSAGVTIGVENTASSEPSPLAIAQSGDGFICAGARAGMALAVWVYLSVLKSGITVRDCEIAIPGCDGATIFLVEHPEGSPSYKAFGWLDLKWGDVLNHRIFTERPLARGVNLEGFVVAQSFDPLPSQFQTGMNIGAKISLFDQSDNFYTSGVELRVDRRPQAGLYAREGSRLFGPEEVIEPAATTVGLAVTGPAGHLKAMPPAMRKRPITKRTQ